VANNRLYICQTCMRDKSLAQGEPSLGRQLADAVASVLSEDDLNQVLSLRRVSCLNGCKSPCNIALRGERKFNLRFSRLHPTDAERVLAIARAYINSATGDVPETDWPAALRGKLTVRTPPPHLLLSESA